MPMTSTDKLQLDGLMPSKATGDLANNEFELKALMDSPNIQGPSMGQPEAASEGSNIQPALDLGLAGDPLGRAGEVQDIEAPEGDEEWGYGKIFVEGAKHSPIGISIKTGLKEGVEAGLGHLGLTMPDYDEYDPTDEDLQLALDNGISYKQYGPLMRGVRTKEEYDSKLQTIKESRLSQSKAADKGITGSIVGGIGDMLGDPLTYAGGFAVKGVQGASIAMKAPKLINNKLTPHLIANAGTAAASEAFFRNQITGQDVDVAGATLGAIVMTAGLHGAGVGINKALQNRIEATETAINTNSQDPTFQANPKGVPKFLDDGEGGQIEVTESGKVVSAGLIPPKASTDIRFGAFTDLATKAANADSPELRALAAEFSRPTQGYKGDAFAAEVPAAESIKRSLDNRTSSLMFDLQGALDDLTDRNLLMGGGIEQRANFGKRIAHHIQGYPLDKPLNDVELKAADAIRQHLSEYAEYMRDPSRLSGRSDAPSLHSSFIDDGSYIPRVYKRTNINRAISKHGEDKVIQAVSDSWENAYAKADPKVKARYDKAILDEHNSRFKAEGEPDATAVTPEMVRSYTARKAYGVVKGDDGVVYSADLFADSATGAVGGKNLNYLKNRTPLATNGDAMLDGQPFRLDDFVDYNLETVLGSYFRNVAGHVSITSSTGKSVDELSGLLDSMTPTSKADAEALNSLREQMKVFTGQARDDYNMTDVVADTIRDVTFAGNNAMMAMANALEIMKNTFARPEVVLAAGKHFTRAIGRDLKSIAGMTPKEIKAEFSDVVSGNVAATRLNLTYSDWLEGAASRLGMTVDELTATQKRTLKARYAGIKVSQQSPFTYLLNKTQEAIVKSGNEVGLGELISYAHGRGKSSLVSPKFLKANGITQDVADRAIAYLRDMEAEKLADREAGMQDVTAWSRDRWLQDPRSADVERILQAFNDELIMKQDNVGQQYYKPLNWAGRLLLQFKRFAVTSSQYAVRTYKDIVQLGRMDSTLTLMGSVAFTGFGSHVALGMYRAQGISDDYEREKYVRELLDYKSDRFWIGIAQRTPVLAWPSLVLGDVLGGVMGWKHAGASRTTSSGPKIGEGDFKGLSSGAIVSNAGSTFMNMVPAARTAAHAGSIAVNTPLLAWDSLVDDKTLNYQSQERAKRSVAKSVQGLLPNDPMMKRFYSEMMHVIDVDMDKK